MIQRFISICCAMYWNFHSEKTWTSNQWSIPQRILNQSMHEFTDSKIKFAQIINAFFLISLEFLHLRCAVIPNWNNWHLYNNTLLFILWLTMAMLGGIGYSSGIGLLQCPRDNLERFMIFWSLWIQVIHRACMEPFWNHCVILQRITQKSHASDFLCNDFTEDFTILCKIKIWFDAFFPCDIYNIKLKLLYLPSC